jgi:hypothetical protein
MWYITWISSPLLANGTYSCLTKVMLNQMVDHWFMVEFQPIKKRASEYFIVFVNGALSKLAASPSLVWTPSDCLAQSIHLFNWSWLKAHLRYKRRHIATKCISLIKRIAERNPTDSLILVEMCCLPLIIIIFNICIFIIHRFNWFERDIIRFLGARILLEFLLIDLELLFVQQSWTQQTTK